MNLVYLCVSYNYCVSVIIFEVFRDVDDKHKLLTMWKKDKNYLFSAYSQWLPQSTHSDLKTVWPPIAE